MKKIIVITIILAATVFLYALRDKSPAEEIRTPQTSKNDTFRPDPSNATFIFDDGEVTLSAGRNERNVSPGSALVEEIALLDKFAYGDVNADGKEDTVLLLARYGSGSGIFIYLAAFVSGPVTYRGSQAAFIGDRISPQSISVDNATVTVKYLDRGEDEPLAAEPTVPTSRQFVYRAGEFEER